MELWLNQGDYVPDGAGGFVTLAGEEELLQRVLFRLCARRGAFPLLPELGSRLWLLGTEKPGSRLSAAREYVEEALEEENVSVERVSLSDGGEGRILVNVWLRRNGETMEVTVGV